MKWGTRNVLTAVAAAGSLTYMAVAGPLDPPAGPIAATYKTLADVEPRTAVSATNTPGTATCLYRITVPGSYYLTGNVQGVAGKNGIEIASSDVTLDLGGFTLTGVANSGAGVLISSAARVVVRNGFINTFAGGGVDGPVCSRSTFEHLTVAGNGVAGGNRSGISVASDCRMDACSAFSNLAGGINCGSGALLSECISSWNTGFGFQFGLGTTVRGCTARGNTSTAFKGSAQCVLDSCIAIGDIAQLPAGWGFSLSTDCRVSACVAAGYTTGIEVSFGSTVQGCSTYSTVTAGIAAFDDAVIAGCTTRTCVGAGISARNGVTITGCTAIDNGSDNIVVQNRCVVKDCIATGSTLGYGINATGLSNLITGCNASANKLSGIRASQRSKVADCVCKDNQGSGIHATFVTTVTGCVCDTNAACGILCDAGGFDTIMDNTCTQNGAATNGAGIRISGASGNRIEHNTMSFNYRNLDIQTGSNLIFKNSLGAAGAGGHYVFAAGNSYGPMVNVTGVGDISATAGAGQPMANFIY